MLDLRIGGARYQGWTSVRVTRSMEQLAASFSLGVVGGWSDDDFPVLTGAECALLDDAGRRVLTGYIDDVAARYQGDTRSMTLSGRSRAGDLVDCSAVHKTGQWKEASPLVIARDLCLPFGIAVTAAVDLIKPLPRFTLQQGESVFEALERAARMRGFLVTSKPTGDVVITQVGRSRSSTALQRGVNVVSAERRASTRDRYSVYTVKAQTAGTDGWHGAEAAQQSRSAVDGPVKRYRPLVMIAEDQGSGDELETRATWERNVRAGRSRRYTYEVLGWGDSNGLWAPNTLVRVVDDWLGVDDELLIVTATQTLDERGTRTQLELMRPEAFSVLALPPEKEGLLG